MSFIRKGTLPSLQGSLPRRDPAPGMKVMIMTITMKVPVEPR